jgi:hypothetical protein
MKTWSARFDALDAVLRGIQTLAAGAVFGSILAVVVCIAFDVPLRLAESNAAGIFLASILVMTIVLWLCMHLFGRLLVSLLNALFGERGRRSPPPGDSTR